MPRVSLFVPFGLLPLGLLLLGAAPAIRSSSSAGPLARPVAPFVTVPRGPASFFVTSRGLDGGNLGGLAGADAQCQRLALEAGLPEA